jgi:hypothetical protein
MWEVSSVTNAMVLKSRVKETPSITEGSGEVIWRMAPVYGLMRNKSTLVF